MSATNRMPTTTPRQAVQRIPNKSATIRQPETSLRQVYNYTTNRTNGIWAWEGFHSAIIIMFYYAIMAARHTVQYTHIHMSYTQIHPLKTQKDFFKQLKLVVGYILFRSHLELFAPVDVSVLSADHRRLVELIVLGHCQFGQLGGSPSTHGRAARGLAWWRLGGPGAD